MMRKIPGLLFVFLVLFSLGACKDADALPIIAIDIDETSIAEFYHMEDFDLGEIEVILQHEDGSSSRVPLDESMLAEDDLALLETAGVHTITVYHAMSETVITIVIIEPGAVEQTIFFETGIDPAIDPLVAYSGTPIDAPSDPQREGHTFLGWFRDESLETPFVFDVMPVEDLTLYAKWEIQTYLVTFYDSDNITVLATSIVDHGEAAVAPADPLKEDTAEFTYTFDGWDKDVSDVRENMDVFPTYLESINYYTVTFWNYNGTVLTEEIVAYGHEAIAPEGPPKADTPQFTYTFDGWDTDVSDVRENMDVFPTYVSSTRNYTVTFLDADGTLIKEESVPYALAATPPSDPIKEHYTFTGWNQSFDRIVFDLTVYAQYTTNSYTVTFKDHDETILKTESVLYDTAATPPDNPARVGYTWVGWDTPIENIASDLVVHAIYEIASYQLIFEDIEGNILHAESFEYNEDIPEIIFPEAPDLTGHTFDGWEALPETMPPHHLIFTASYTHNVLNISMVRIGYREAIYTIPTRTSDSKTVDVAGGYYMATYETTYGLWYTVRMWAEDNGYSFQNPGREGDSGTDGMPPTENHKNKPVTYVSWRDAIVWTNALSEISHLDPVYRTDTGVIIRDARAANGAVVDAAIQTNHNGYRLPTSDEWEMAARWRNTDGDGSILVGGRYWTPGNYASGATDNYENEEASRAVAWYSGAEGGSFTRPVGQLMPNHLGLYDMCGNVWEWTYTAQSYTRIMRGGSYSYIAQMIRLGNTLAFNTTQASVMGFRLARG